MPDEYVHASAARCQHPLRARGHMTHAHALLHDAWQQSAGQTNREFVRVCHLQVRFVVTWWFVIDPVVDLIKVKRTGFLEQPLCYDHFIFHKSFEIDITRVVQQDNKARQCLCVYIYQLNIFNKQKTSKLTQIFWKQFFSMILYLIHMYIQM